MLRLSAGLAWPSALGRIDSMKYTARFAHLDDGPMAKVGDVLNRGDVIGVMGNTGVGTGAHLHLDVVEGIQAGRYTLTDVANGGPKASPKQAVLFIDKELFRVEPVVTTGYADPEYYRSRGKWHFAFDVVPEDRHQSKAHFAIHWNRTAQGVVIKAIRGDTGYGNYLLVGYEA